MYYRRPKVTEARSPPLQGQYLCEFFKSPGGPLLFIFLLFLDVSNTLVNERVRTHSTIHSFVIAILYLEPIFGL
jgi:hypothetical protein